MKVSWKSQKVKDIATVVGGGTPSTKNDEYWNGDIPWITPRDLSNKRSKYTYRGEKLITQKGLENSSAKLLPKNSLLFSSRAPIGYMTINKCPVSTNQGFQSLVPNENYSIEYLYYLFKSKIDYIKSYATGSTFEEISGSEVKNLEFLIPNFDEQKNIAGILSLFDEKIDLNKKMNQNLEDIGMTIFKSWFIDFDPVIINIKNELTDLPKEIIELFPNSFEDSKLGKIPKGWKIKKLSDFSNENNKKINPNQYPEEFFETYDIPSFDNISYPSIKKGTSLQSQKSLISANMILISKLNPHTPRIWNPLEESNYKKVSSTEFISLIPKKDFKFFLLCHLKSYKSIRTLSSMVVGTSKSHQRIRKKDIFELETLCFPDTIAILFEDNLKQIYKKIEFNLNQIKILTELRDALLPKLISGKLRISDAEKIISKVSV